MIFFLLHHRFPRAGAGHVFVDVFGYDLPRYTESVFAPAALFVFWIGREF